MEIDKTTYEDLSLFNHEEEASIFHKVNFTRTRGGRDWLFQFFNKPFSDITHIQDTQKIITLMLANLDQWPLTISNGTVMVMERFYESALDDIPQGAGLLNGITYKIFHAPDFSLLRYSLGHFADFARGMKKIIEIFDKDGGPAFFRSYLARARFLLDHEVIQAMTKVKSSKDFTWGETVHFGHYVRGRFKPFALELIEIYGRMDAWYSMAVACRELHLTMPVFHEGSRPFIEAQSLYHILLQNPVSYNIRMNEQANFVFLTGANMAGKSTFIKSVGAAVFLAHVGMGVPAEKMDLSLFDGILSNINVVDNLVKGESYFFNEVQRIRNTLIKISDKRKWLVLIDELFKGTNVQDAMKCSSTVIKGLIKISNSLFILSTHLYEIGEEMKQFPNIIFLYFETTVHEDQLEFSYQLKSGISNDRLGYLILKREKVVEMLEKL
ncbi:MAG: DNA mismatch repair protein MutS [Bacteroidetes bacterium]|nr:MAG: DNA mismatch repair protein MutS [Bacteroidota bacterium]